MKLSIIVPVYNVEQYIRPCIQSIYRQSLQEKDFEVILVNDGTLDNSFERISDIINEHDNIIVVEQNNQGLSVARNTGLLHAEGDYVLFIDSDDLLIDNSLSIILDGAIEYSADLIVADFVKMTDQEIMNNTNDYEKRNSILIDIKAGKDMFLYDLNPQQCYVWRTLYRRSFLESFNLRFIPGIYFEDIPFTTDCYLKANKCVRISQLFYIYRQRKNSIVSSVNMNKLKDLNTVVAYLWNLKDDNEYSIDIDRKIMDVMFVTFSIAIWYLTHNKKLLFQKTLFVSDLKKKVPDLQFTNGVKQKIVSLLYRSFPMLYIWIRSKLF